MKISIFWRGPTTSYSCIARISQGRLDELPSWEPNRQRIAGCGGMSGGGILPNLYD